MSIVSGDGQHGPPGVELPDPLIARIENSRGRPVIGQIVNFRVVLGGGSVFAGATISNRDGLVSERWTLGAAGAQRVEVRAVDPETGNPLTFAVFGRPSTPSRRPATPSRPSRATSTYSPIPRTRPTASSSVRS